MNAFDTLNKLTGAGIIPIIRERDETKIIRIAEALIQGGCGVFEISLSVAGSLKILESIARRYGDRILLGAGTVLDADTAKSAIAAGARFIVSPGTFESVIDVCKKSSVAVCPGALTPTEIVHAWNLGADAIKVFPCDVVGGPAFIRSIKAPLPDIVLFPCGGVTMRNAGDYFNAGTAALFVGSALTACAMQGTGSYDDEIIKKTSLLLEVVHKARTV
jgi:2-dehydro-3-deoxyphosphogluconate aldolase/(4S)-4-hydroxy-2-oxoglutarate aldolase